MKLEIFRIVLYLASALFVLIESALLYSMLRSRRHGDGLLKEVEDGPRSWEVIWSAIPAAILLVLILIV